MSMVQGFQGISLGAALIEPPLNLTCPISGFAMLTLDASDEAMGLVAWTGAALMMGASLLASVGGEGGGDEPAEP